MDLLCQDCPSVLIKNYLKHGNIWKIVQKWLYWQLKKSFNAKNPVYTPFVIFKFDIFNKILPSNFGFVNDISILCPIFLLHFIQIAFRIKWFSTFWIEQKSALKILSTSAPAPSDVRKFVEMILSIDDIKVWHWHLKTACPLKIKI